MIRVIEIGHIVMGPTAGLILADLGFEVIKVEKPGEGDIARRLTGTSSGTFPFYNRGKKSLTLDFNNPKGKDILLRLVQRSDIIIDNLGYGSLAKAGLSYDILKEVNPSIIYLSLKGYGKGPYEARKSLDYPIEVHSGIAYMNGLEGRPMRLGASLVDMTAAMFGVIWVLKALLDREKTGEGTFIDIGMFETAVFMMGQHISTYQVSGKPLKPLNEEGFAWAIYDFFKTKDNKEIFIGVTTDNQWKMFCNGFDLDICDDVRFSRNELRYQYRDELLKIIQEKVGQYDYSEVEKILTKLNIAYAVLHKPWELLDDPHMKSKLVTTHYNGLEIKIPPIPNSHREGSTPNLGENTEEILLSLGYSKEDIDSFKKLKII